jgi:DNA repair ATPase RecN
MKAGQVAHLNHNASDNRPENLVFLCLQHHDQYDSRTSQSKGLTPQELVEYRRALHQWVENNLAWPHVDSALNQHMQKASTSLGAEGDWQVTKDEFLDTRQTSIDAMQALGIEVSKLGLDMASWRQIANEASRSENLRQMKSAYKKIGEGLNAKSKVLCNRHESLESSFALMLVVFERLCVLLSDEEITPSTFVQGSIDEAENLAEELERLRYTVNECTDVLKGWNRGTTAYNKGKRLMVASLQDLLRRLDRMLQASRDHRAILEEILDTAW